MKKYYVKLGKMYLYNVYTNNELFKNIFIRDVEFTYHNGNALTINDDEQSNIIEILESIFNMPGVLKDYIKFEEVKEDE